jgi:hypothetical protein
MAWGTENRLKIFAEVKIAIPLEDFGQRIDINGMAEFMRYLISTLYNQLDTLKYNTD